MADKLELKSRVGMAWEGGKAKVGNGLVKNNDKNNNNNNNNNNQGSPIITTKGVLGRYQGQHKNG